MLTKQVSQIAYIPKQQPIIALMHIHGQQDGDRDHFERSKSLDALELPFDILEDVGVELNQAVEFLEDGRQIGARVVIQRGFILHEPCDYGYVGFPGGDAVGRRRMLHFNDLAEARESHLEVLCTGAVFEQGEDFRKVVYECLSELLPGPCLRAHLLCWRELDAHLHPGEEIFLLLRGEVVEFKGDELFLKKGSADLLRQNISVSAGFIAEPPDLLARSIQHHFEEDDLPLLAFVVMACYQTFDESRDRGEALFAIHADKDVFRALAIIIRARLPIEYDRRDVIVLYNCIRKYK
jgi:hypothetical protein